MTRRKKIAYALSKVLDSVSWEHRVVEDVDGETLIHADMEIDAGFCNCCNVTFSIADEDVLLMCSPHLAVKEVYRKVVAEYFTYVNYYLRWGRWVLSPEDGDVQFRYRKDEASFAVDATQALTDMIATAEAIIENALQGVYGLVMGMWTMQQAIDAYRDVILKKTAQTTSSSSSDEAIPGLCLLRPSDYITNVAKEI